MLGKSPGSTCKKNPHVIALAKEIKSNSSFFNNDANTTLLNDMNATLIYFDSSDMLEGKEIAETSWAPTNTQISHSLTKKGVPSFKILEFMSELKESSVWCLTFLFSFAELMPYRNEKKKGEELLRHEVTSPDTFEKRERYSMTGSKQTAILVYVRV